MVYTCHCTDCQRINSSAFSIGIVVAENAFRLSGIEPRSIQRTADSGRVSTRLVCPECGSWVCGTPRMAWSGLALERSTIPPGCRRRGISGPAASSPGSHCRQMTRFLRWHHPPSSTSPPARTGCAVLSPGKSWPVISTSAVSAETSHRRDTDAV